MHIYSGKSNVTNMVYFKHAEAISKIVNNNLVNKEYLEIRLLEKVGDNNHKLS